MKINNNNSNANKEKLTIPSGGWDVEAGTLIHSFGECKLAQLLWKIAYNYLPNLNIGSHYIVLGKILGVHKT